MAAGKDVSASKVLHDIENSEAICPTMPSQSRSSTRMMNPDRSMKVCLARQNLAWSNAGSSLQAGAKVLRAPMVHQQLGTGACHFGSDKEG